jgi:phage N-6-adenine-methyltransferase
MNNERYTPEWLVKEIESFYGGEVYLDAFYDARSFVKPVHGITKNDNALSLQWRNVYGIGKKLRYLPRVFCNPPYSRSLIKPCINKIVTEFETNNSYEDEFLVLVKHDASTQWWQLLSKYPRLEFNQRLKFYSPDTGEEKSAADYPVVMFYMGNHLNKFATHFKNYGTVSIQYILNEVCVCD